jgi:glycosyltransferase involved in cell wall biosynthesis
MTVRRQIAFFNPIFAHYRTALLRELCASTRNEFHFFADTADRYGRIPVAELPPGARFTRLRYIRVLKWFAWQWGTLRPTLFGRFDAYILEGDAYYLSSWLGAIAARMRGRRVLFWSHGWTRTDRGLKGLIRRTFYRLADGLLLYGDRARDIGIREGFDSDRLFVMYNSLDCDRQRECAQSVGPAQLSALRSRLFGPDPVPVVIATARLTGQKRFDLLVRALGLINRGGRRVDLLLVGDGPARAGLEKLATSERVNAVFVGSCYDEQQLATLYACASVTGAPGEIGLTCMHSLGYGVPIVTHADPASQMPEWEAIIPGVTGDLFKPGDVNDLAAKLERWTQQPGVPEQTRHACQSRIAQRYNPRMQASAIEAALEEPPSRARRAWAGSSGH